ncbi:hypothetical protein PMN64_35770 [Bradyrhizobium sp. UFLA01-814]|uniref:hypothetical protein n=1 Tax=Bradyrhizobium sp. UFLA01-814 TaxID=3023480 RepID=UPI00398A6563
MNEESDAVEAFLELSEGQPLQSASWSVGYRLIGSGEVICAIKLPLAVAEAARLPQSRISIVLTAAGRIEVFAGGSLENESIDELVAKTVAEENLRLEEASGSDLRSLLDRLEHSVSLVKEAIARMPPST